MRNADSVGLGNKIFFIRFIHSSESRVMARQPPTCPTSTNANSQRKCKEAMPRHGRLVLRWLAYGIVGAALCLVSLLPFILLQSETRSAHHQDKAVLPARGADEDDVVHIVFSTDCSGYQHWQSIALWYAAQSAGHPGPVTRFASGCSQDEDMRRIADEFSRIDGGRNRFRAHFTPAMQLQGDYKYSNKPGGLKHWLHNAEIEEEFIVLLDPDMLPLLPITTRLGQKLDPIPRRREATKQLEYFDKQSGIARLLRVDDADLLPLTDRVALGRPAGQHFGLGGTWAYAPANPIRYPNWRNFSKALVCGEGSPCTRTSDADAKKKYAVGPVYLAHIENWKSIADSWWRSMEPVHLQHPYLLAEMMALTMAVANLTLPWTLVSNYMVTGVDVDSATEAWSWIDDLIGHNASNACAGASSTTLPFITRDRSAVALPATLHYCQRYKFANHLFAKRKVPHDFFRCDGGYLSFDQVTIMNELSVNNEKLKRSEKRSAFMMCHLIPMMNAALDSYKVDVCDY